MLAKTLTERQQFWLTHTVRPWSISGLGFRLTDLRRANWMIKAGVLIQPHSIMLLGACAA